MSRARLTDPVHVQFVRGNTSAPLGAAVQVMSIQGETAGDTVRRLPLHRSAIDLRRAQGNALA